MRQILRRDTRNEHSVIQAIHLTYIHLSPEIYNLKVNQLEDMLRNGHYGQKKTKKGTHGVGNC